MRLSQIERALPISLVTEKLLIPVYQLIAENVATIKLRDAKIRLLRESKDGLVPHKRSREQPHLLMP